MILADKIIEERKRNGWSQEELAEKLGVSRQSVSKWESAQSVPDLNRIIKMAELFGVTTDYLLKDEIEKSGNAGSFDGSGGSARKNSQSQHGRSDGIFKIAGKTCTVDCLWGILMHPLSGVIDPFGRTGEQQDHWHFGKCRRRNWNYRIIIHDCRGRLYFY